MTGEEMRAIDNLELNLRGLNAKFDDLNSYIRDEAVKLAGKVATLEAASHRSEDCRPLMDLAARVATQDAVFSSDIKGLQITWAKLMGLLVGAGAAGGISGIGLNKLIS